MLGREHKQTHVYKTILIYLLFFGTKDHAYTVYQSGSNVDFFRAFDRKPTLHIPNFNNLASNPYLTLLNNFVRFMEQNDFFTTKRPTN